MTFPGSDQYALTDTGHGFYLRISLGGVRSLNCKMQLAQLERHGQLFTVNVDAISPVKKSIKTGNISGHPLVPV